MREKRHFAIGMSDAHLKFQDKRTTFIHDDETLVFGVFDSLNDTSHSADAVDAFALAIRATLRENRKVLDKYARSGSYFHRVRATLIFEMAIQQGLRQARTALSAAPEGQALMPRPTVLLLAGSNVIVAHSVPGDAFQIREERVKHLTAEAVKQPIRDDSGKVSSPTSMQKSRMKETLLGTSLTGSARVPKIEFIHTEAKAGDVFVIANAALGTYLIENARIKELAIKDMAAENLKRAIRLASLARPSEIVTGMVLKVFGAVTSPDQLKLEERIAPLRHIPVFKLLQTHELLKLLQLMEAREFKPNEKVINEDEPGELLYVSVKGNFSVFKNGNLVAQLAEGAVFGEIGFINGMPRTADVVSNGKSLILILSRSKVRKLLASEPQIASHLLWSLCQVLNDRLANTTKELSSLMAQNKKKGSNPDEPIGLIEEGEENRQYIFNEIKKSPRKPIPKFDDEK